ncbi:hypothetical protein OAP63_06455 [Vibrio sp.]|nr:hypothetical protein [Vibrio sp.]
MTICLLVSMSVTTYASDIIIVTNKSSELKQLSRNEIRQIFLGGTLSRKYEPISLATDNKTRTLFNTKVLGLTEGRVRAYWAQLLFTGRSQPPKAFDSTSAAVDYLLANSNVVGYLPADYAIPNGLVVVYEK